MTSFSNRGLKKLVNKTKPDNNQQHISEETLEILGNLRSMLDNISEEQITDSENVPELFIDFE